MVERIVLFKLNQQWATEAGRAEVADHTRTALAEVPGVKSLSVGVPADEEVAKSWDLSVVLRFDSLDDAESYRVHPKHRAYVDDYMKPKMEVVKAWNFRAG